MQRLPEPELMDDPAQARAYAEADFAAAHQMLVDAFDACLPGQPPPARVLDLGCGPADVTLRFARRWPQARIDGVDGAPAMLALGRERVARAGLAPRVQLHALRLPAQDFPAAPYDAIVSNSLLHHLHEPQALWETIRAAGRPGSAVYVADLMRPRNHAQLQALVAQHAAGAPPVLERDFRLSLQAAFRPQELRAQLAAAGLGHFSVQVLSDRHLAVAGLLR